MFRLKGDNIMKKLIAVACTALLLAGCGSSSNEVKKESKTCTLNEKVMGMTAEVKLDAEDDVVKKVVMSYTMPSSLLGGDASELAEEDMETLKASMLSAIGATEGERVAVSAKAVEKDLRIDVDIDLEKVDATVLKNLNLKGNTKNIKLSETVESAEKDGEMTCK